MIHGDDYATRDGTGVRDYVHALDLAAAHALALRALGGGAPSAVYDLGGGGDGYTVREVVDTARRATGVVDTARRATGRPITAAVGARRPGEPAVLVASSTRIRRALGWSPRHQDLAEIIASAWTCATSCA